MNDNEKNVMPEEPRAESVSNGYYSEETYYAEPEAPKSKVAQLLDKVKGLGKLPLILGGAVAVILVIALVVSLIGSTPMALLGTGIKNSAKAIMKDDTVELISGVLNGGSIELACDMEELTENLTGQALAEGNASVKLYSKGTAAALIASIQMDKSEVVDLGVYMNQKDIAVKSEWLLGDDAYGINLKKAMENFKTSEFGPDGEYSLGIELNEDMEKSMAEAEKLAKDMMKIGEDAMATVLKSVRKNAEISKKTTKISLGDKDVKTSAITLEMDHEQLFNVFKDAMEYVHTDKELKKFITENIGTILMASGEVVDEDEDLQEYVDMFYENLDEAMEEIDELAEEFEDADISIKLTFYVSKSGKQLIGVEFKAEADDEPIRGYVYAGPDLKNLQEISFRLNMDGETAHGSYVIKTDDSKEFEAKLKIVDPDNDNITCTIFWDKKDGDFEVEYDEYGWYVVTVEGNMEKSGKKNIITIETIDDDGDEIDLNLNLILASSDRMPSVPKYTDVLTMSVDDIEDLMDDIQSNASEIMSNPNIMRVLYRYF